MRRLLVVALMASLLIAVPAGPAIAGEAGFHRATFDPFDEGSRASPNPQGRSRRSLYARPSTGLSIRPARVVAVLF